jgi:hypothetical protein
MFLIPFVSVLIPILLGQRYGQNRKKKSKMYRMRRLAQLLAQHSGCLPSCLPLHFKLLAIVMIQESSCFLKKLQT